MIGRSKRHRVLVVDDELIIREFITSILEEKYAVLTAANGLEAVRLLRNEKPDIILLDILMPGDDGIVCLQEIRSLPDTVDIPVIMLTALNESEVRIRSFAAGADDFITKPFQPEELIARIESKIGRFKNLTNVTSLVLRLGNVVVDLATLRVTVGTREIELGPIEFKILSLLMRHKGRLTRREELENFVWPIDKPSDPALETHVGSLSAKLRDSEIQVQTIHGSGYSLLLRSNDF